MDYTAELLARPKLVRWLHSRGLSMDAIVNNGVGWHPEDRIDKYSERILFPVYGMDGQIVSYQARSLTETPKYWYKSYDKPSHLEGLWNCLEAVITTRQITLVEGPIDRILLNQLGYPAGSLLGATFHGFQAFMLGGLCDTVFCALDNDETGDKGTQMIERAMEPYGTKIIRIKFKSGKDPSAVYENTGSLEVVGRTLGRAGCTRVSGGLHRRS